MNRVRMNILYCCDDNYAQHLCVCMTSLAMNNARSDLNILAVVRDLSDANRRKIMATMSRFDHVALCFAEPVAVDEAIFKIRVHYTVDTYQRLWIRQHFPTEDRVLYLDPDMVVLDDLRALWDTDLEGYIFGAVPIPGSDRPAWFRMPEGTPYCNTGVILFNLPEWDRANCPQVLIDFTARNGKYLRDADQDTLNFCLAGRWKPLESRYNMLGSMFSNPAVAPEHVASPAVRHYSGNNKPWVYGSNPPKKSLYWQYLAQTEFHDYVEPDRTLRAIVTHSLSRVLPPAVKGAIRRFRPEPPRVLPPRPDQSMR